MLLKDKMGFSLKNFDILGVHEKIQLLAEGLQKTDIKGGIAYKEGLRQFEDLRRDLANKRRWCFWRRGGGGGLYPNAYYAYAAQFFW